MYYYYIYSFVAIAFWGLFQFVFGLLGINLLITQWWIDGILPRLNGFSYEPSYFSSYLLIGWSILLFLYFEDRLFFNKFKYSFLFLTLVIILSTSRMALLMMLIASAALWVKSSYSSFKRLRIKLRDGKILLLISFFVLFLLNNLQKISEYSFLFSGIGLLGTPTHSMSSRIDRAISTFQIFLNNPIMGHSLGGVAPAIAELEGCSISTQIEAKSFEGMSILVEVLAASGIFGFFFFCLFFAILFWRAHKIAIHLKKAEHKGYLIVSSLSFALLIELAVLSMNQNILRPYLWVLIGMLSASICIGKRCLHELAPYHRL